MNKTISNENSYIDLNIRWHHTVKYYMISIEVYENNKCVNCMRRQILLDDKYPSVLWADDDFIVNPTLYYKELQFIAEEFAKRFINMKAFI